MRVLRIGDSFRELAPHLAPGAPRSQLSTRRTGIVTVRILRTDLSVNPVNHKFGMLISRNASRDCDGLSLCCGASGRSLVPGAFDLPTAVCAASDVLILTHDSTSN